MSTAFEATDTVVAAAGCCRVCGSARIVVDEVVGHGALRLAECVRCRHRWTRPLEPARPRPLARAGSRPAPGAASWGRSVAA
jgi:hypothetical protein